VPGTPRLRWSVVEESLDEAAFLWAKRERALDSCSQDLDTLWRWTEERLLGALDGILCGGDAVLEPMLAPALEEGASSRASVAVFLLASMGSDAAIPTLAQALQQASDPILASFRHGLELGLSDVALKRILRVIGKPRIALQALLTNARAFRGEEAISDLKDLLLSEDSATQAAAMRAARNAPRAIATSCTEYALGLPQPEARIEAIETGLMLGMPSAWAVCLEMLGLRNVHFTRLSIAAASLGGEREHKLIESALDNKALRRDALFALGFAGTPAAAEVCLDGMANRTFSKVAAESFCAITGLDLALEKLIVPENEPTGLVPFEEDDLDADLVPTLDAELPMPDVDGVKRWWKRKRKDFAPKQRTIAGQPASLLSLHARLVNGPMRRRHGLAFEFAVRTGGKHQIRTRAFTQTQRAQLKAAETVFIEDLKSSRPFNVSARQPW